MHSNEHQYTKEKFNIDYDFMHSLLQLLMCEKNNLIETNRAFFYIIIK